MNKILAIIPARSGSKGIKNKNIIGVDNKPLVFYTINPALKMKKNGLVNEVIVSTDSSKIADISKKLGASVPFLRPEIISGDKAKSVDFILHAIEYFEKKGIFYDYVILLQPTSPLRKYEDIKDALELYLKSKNDSLISVYCANGIIESIIYTKEGNTARPVLSRHNKGVRRQDAKKIFVRNGAIYIVSVKYIKRNYRIISDRPILFEMPEKRSLNIDTKEDLKKLHKIICK
jgi:CMP-N,N'-diacetyllegionaminic acid synthase